MGGGGGGPDGYNESQSLLQGGTDAPIVKMTGGGPKEDAAAAKAEAEAVKAEAEAAKAEAAAKKAEVNAATATMESAGIEGDMAIDLMLDAKYVAEKAAKAKAVVARAAAVTARARIKYFI